MDDTKLQEPVASSESPAAPDSAHSAEVPQSSIPPELSNHSAAVQVPERQPGVYAPITVDAPGANESELADFARFLKRTWRIWAIAAAVIVGLILTVAGVERLKDMLRAAQLKRYDRAVASLTPDRLIARCGQPVEDNTKEVFPVVLRTIHYKPWIGEPLVFAFSRTDEQKSDWVFLTMKNEDGTKSFDSSEDKIAAFSCLDSTK